MQIQSPGSSSWCHMDCHITNWTQEWMCRDGHLWMCAILVASQKLEQAVLQWNMFYRLVWHSCTLLWMIQSIEETHNSTAVVCKQESTKWGVLDLWQCESASENSAYFDCNVIMWNNVQTMVEVASNILDALDTNSSHISLEKSLSLHHCTPPFPTTPSIYSSFSQKYSNKFDCCVVNSNVMWYSTIMTAIGLVELHCDEGATYASPVFKISSALSSEPQNG